MSRKFTYKEAINHATSHDFGITVIDDASTGWVSGESTDETQHIQVNGYHKLLFTFSSTNAGLDVMGFTFSKDPEDIVLASSTTHMELPPGTYEITIPTAVGGVDISGKDTLYWNVIASAANAVIRIVKE
jgi:hypothetical protein